MQNTPLHGAGRRPAPHPFLAIIPSPTAIYLCLHFNPLCVEYVRIVSCKNMQPFMKWGKKSKSTCSICVGVPGRLPAPSPCSVGGAVGGRGGAGRVQPGDSEQGRGDLWQASRELKWQIFLASKFGGLFSRVNPAGCHGKIFWRVILAHLFGGSLWHIYLTGFHSQ
jgi:hypothetical protein